MARRKEKTRDAEASRSRSRDRVRQFAEAPPEKARKKKKLKKDRPEREVSIDSEDLRPPQEESSKAAQQDSTGVNFRELYRKAAKSMKEQSSPAEQPDANEGPGDIDFEEIEAMVAAKKNAEMQGSAVDRGSSSESDAPATKPAPGARRQMFFGATPTDSMPAELRETAQAVQQPPPQQQLMSHAQQRSPCDSDDYSDDEPPGQQPDRKQLFFAATSQASMPVVTTRSETRPDGPKVGVSGIDFGEVRRLRQEEEEKEALEKTLEVAVPVKARERLQDTVDLKQVQEKMAQDLEKAKRVHEAAKKEAADREQQELEYYHATLGELCGPEDRFIIIEELGKGEFASVFRCRDKEVRDSSGALMEYAIKFTRNNENLIAAMERELMMLGNICTQAVTLDPEGCKHILGLMFLNGFEQEGHLCCVYELMKCDLRVAMQRYTSGSGFPLYPTLRSLARQLILALRALRACQILHCDVKPDNMLLALDRQTVKLSDFGSAIEDSERKRTEYLQPRHYRCPEVILGQTYSTQIDMWSAGCTIYQLATGKPLFVGEHNNAMLHEYMKVTGPFSKHFATDGHFSKKHFNFHNGDFLNANGDHLVDTLNPAVLPMSHFEIPRRPFNNLIEAIPKPPGLDPKRFQGLKGHLVNLLKKLCAINPEERALPEEALQLKFFEQGAGG